MECSCEELDYTKNGITSKACCCINICSIKLGVTPAKHRMQIQLLYSFIHLWKKKLLLPKPMICFPTGELYFRTSPCKWKWNIPGCLGSNLKRSGNSCPNWRSWLGAYWSFYRIKMIKMIKRSMLPWWKGSLSAFCTYYNYIFWGSNWFKS